MYAGVAARVDEARAKGRPVSEMAKVSATWLDTIRWNATLWDGVQHFYLARLDHAGGAYGAAVGRLHHAATRATEALNACTDERLRPQFAEWRTRIADEYDSARDENEKVYHELVKAVAELPPPERKCMVSATPPPEETEQVAIMPKLGEAPDA